MNSNASLLLTVVALLAGCGGDSSAPVPPPPPPAVPASIAISDGNQQTAAAGSPVTTAPTVIVRDAQSRPVSGVAVQFAIAAGGGTLEGASQTTDAAGTAKVGRWTLGTSGAQRLSATVTSLPAVTFEATLTPGTESIEVSLPTGGGNLEITTTGHPYRGLKLTVPAGAFADAASWRVRVVTLPTPPALPAGFEVAGPVLEVATDAPRAKQLVRLDVPITTPAGRAVLLALRDPARGFMEFLTPVARTASSISVVTAHLRGDLLVGRAAGAAARPAGLHPLIGVGPAVAQLIPVALPLPLPAIAPVLNPATERWPVVDNGSATTPGGFGAAIPAFEALSMFSGGPPFAPYVKGLAQPGFYADAATLAALEVADKRLRQAMAGLISSVNDQLRQLPKSQRDELVNQLINGNIAMLRAVLPVAFTRPGQPDAGFGVAYSSSSQGFGATNQATKVLVALGFDPVNGFSPQAVKQTADGPTITTDGVIPLPSTLLPFDQLGDLLTPLQQLAGLTGQARFDFNRQFAQLAGLSFSPIETRVLPSDAWLPITSGPAVIRVLGSTVRLSLFNTPVLVHETSNGTQVLQSPIGTITLGNVPAFTSLPRAVPASFVVSPFVNAAGSLKQLLAQTIDIAYAPFEVTPDPAQLDAQKGVAFDASVPLPPSGGFRIGWEWDDGKVSDNLGLTQATHTYDAVGDYSVIATMRSVSGTVLGADTVSVKSASSPYWRITNITDPDSLLEPGDTSPFQVMMARLIDTPPSGLIAVDDDGGGKTVLRLRVLPNGTWLSGFCCPGSAPLAGEMRQALGVRPTVTYNVGPFFAGFGTSEWSESTGDLGAGTLSGQYVEGGLVTRLIKGAGNQAGPRDFIRITATRSGTTMTGTITVFAWFQDGKTGEVDPQYEPTSYVLPFRAERLR